MLGFVKIDVDGAQRKWEDEKIVEDSEIQVGRELTNQTHASSEIERQRLASLHKDKTIEMLAQADDSKLC